MAGAGAAARGVGHVRRRRRRPDPLPQLRRPRRSSGRSTLRAPIFDRVALNAESALSFAVPRLTSALHAARQPMVLMLDDVHHVAGTRSVDALVHGRSTTCRPGVTRRRRRPHRRGAARRAPAREWQAGRDRGRRPRLRRAGGRDAGGARRARAAAARGPRAPRPDRGLAGRRVPRGAPGRSAPQGGQRRHAVGVSGRDTDIGDYLDAELLDHASAAGADVPAARRRSSIG